MGGEKGMVKNLGVIAGNLRICIGYNSQYLALHYIYYALFKWK